MEFCSLVEKSAYDLKWGCSSRVDTLDQELIEIMAQSGCEDMFLGIETGSPKMQELTQKRLKLDNVKMIVQFLKNAEIDYVLSFIYGFPKEEKEDLDLTLKLIYDLSKLDLINYKNLQLHELAFFPGTELLELYQNKLHYNTQFNSTIINVAELPKKILDLIENKKSIFSYLYNIDIKKNYDTYGLDKFFPIVFMRTLEKYKSTYKLLLSFYNNSFVDIYNEYIKSEIEYIKTISFYDSELLGRSIKGSIESIYRFISCTDFDEMTGLIRSIAKFEYDISQFLYTSKETYQVIEYPIDVYNSIKNEDYENLETPVQILFARTDSKNINVCKI